MKFKGNIVDEIKRDFCEGHFSNSKLRPELRNEGELKNVSISESKRKTP